MPETPIERVSTDQLRQGDVVHHNGMRLTIDVEFDTFVGPGIAGDTVYYSPALISNWNEITAQAAADDAEDICNGTAQFIRAHADTDADGNRRWTIQGNRLALWAREIPRVHTIRVADTADITGNARCVTPVYYGTAQNIGIVAPGTNMLIVYNAEHGTAWLCGWPYGAQPGDYPARILHGDVLAIGEHLFRVHCPPDHPHREPDLHRITTN